ncbi:MAG: hypothetical protein HRT72_05845, partial [Flavobacteriales bacterium]|nr:hypothetical protein [Flavobacteriales bacterium]
MKTNKQSLSFTKLTAYSVAAGAVLSSSSAEAIVVISSVESGLMYSNVNPNDTLDIAGFSLDLDTNGVDDIMFSVSATVAGFATVSSSSVTAPGGSYTSWAWKSGYGNGALANNANALGSNAILGVDTVAKGIASGDTIKGDICFNTGNNLLMGADFTGWVSATTYASESNDPV